MRHINTRPRRGGFALVLVLGTLVLITVLVISFLSTATTELKSSVNYSAGVDVRSLADFATNLVIAQVGEATTQPNRVWASQPGAIRSFGDSGAQTTYKLYSSPQWRVEGAYNPAADLASDWHSKPAEWVDLNRPVVSGATSHYPIVSPEGLDNPGTGGVEGIEGLSVDDSLLTPLRAGTTNPLPMPVRWMYVLQDGSIALPSQATRANPIVSRIAFWTDDETSKINVNTAGGDEYSGSGVAGAFWDIPRTNGTPERALALRQPVAREFQRFPGHPATVALSTALPSLNLESIFKVSPRLENGGSSGGRNATVGTGANYTPITPDGDRLYASLDEVMFSPAAGAEGRVPNAPGVISNDALRRAGFVLSAHSRAPEVNVFNKPRVTLWPITLDPASGQPALTTYDQVIAFCSRVGGKDYYFTRQDPNSATVDFADSVRNREIYAYLRQMTSRRIPGASRPMGGTDPSDNTVGKYTMLQRDQILTEMFDYIRTVNLVDTQPGATSYTPPDKPGRAQVVPIKIGAPHAAGDTRGLGRIETITEAVVGLYRVNGSTNPAQLKAFVLFEGFCPLQGYAGMIPSYVLEVDSLDALKIQFVRRANSTGVEVDLGAPVPLNFPSGPLVNHIASSSGAFTRTWGGLSGPVHHLMYLDGSLTNQPKNLSPGGDSKQYFPFHSELEIVAPPSVSGSSTRIKLVGGTVTGRIRLAPGGPVVQEFTFDIPSTAASAEMMSSPSHRFPVRLQNLKADPASGGNRDQLIEGSDFARSVELGGTSSGDARLLALKETVPAGYFQPVKDYEAGRRSVHSLRFGRGQHIRTNAYLDPFNIGAVGKLAKDAVYARAAVPDIPLEINGVTVNGVASLPNSGGDWDNGLGSALDGAYANKADEGAQPAAGTPYFDEGYDSFGQTFFSPNRQIASAVSFGSLPTGSHSNPVAPWRTLLFRPQDGHFGAQEPKDHLWLDLFTMPVVEPYAISEPFSTAGKVNLNHQIMPFNYIDRTTALRAVFKSTQIMAIPVADAGAYKSGGGDYRYPINSDATLAEFKTRFAAQGVFKSASEICEIPLHATGSGGNSFLPDYAGTHALTGDNTREMPYAHLYPLLTTKSNTFTVHMCVQTLRKVRGTPDNAFVDPESTAPGRKDEVLAEYRGSAIIERYLDPNAENFNEANPQAFLGDSSTPYKFRVVSVKKFAP